ncbi:histidine phosphatase family protein [soil metagenome]
MHLNEDENIHKVLLILRHAKSSWKDKKVDDHDRPLNKRGRREAIKMGEHLKKMNMLPDAIISSSAQRAIETTRFLCRYSGYNNLVEVNFSLHRGGVDAYINALATVSNDKQKLLIIGHNPDLEELTGILINRTIRIPTCTLVQLKLSIENWKSIDLHCKFRSELADIWRPKKIE